MMTYESRIPQHTDDRTVLVMLLHGRGATRHDLFGLAPHFPEETIVIAPEAPFPAAPWGYGPGSAWYQFLGGNRPEPHSFSQSLDHIAALLNELKTELQFGPIVLGGFSQGGTISLAYGLTHPGDVAGVINFSGFLADHPAVQAALDATSLNVFWGHGRQDPAIPFSLAIEGRRQLTAAGHAVEAHDYDIGHWIDGDELRAALAWLERVG
jgi:phospholipase/carboxylesterase